MRKVYKYPFSAIFVTMDTFCQRSDFPHIDTGHQAGLAQDWQPVTLVTCLAPSSKSTSVWSLVAQQPLLFLPWSLCRSVIMNVLPSSCKQGAFRRQGAKRATKVVYCYTEPAGHEVSIARV